jgi:hypothetical protein
MLLIFFFTLLNEGVGEPERSRAKPKANDDSGWIQLTQVSMAGLEVLKKRHYRQISWLVPIWTWQYSEGMDLF